MCIGPLNTTRTRVEPDSSSPESVFKPQGAFSAIDMQIPSRAPGPIPKASCGITWWRAASLRAPPARPQRRGGVVVGRPRTLWIPTAGIQPPGAARRRQPRRNRCSHGAEAQGEAEPPIVERCAAPPAMPRAASSERRRGLNLASARSPARPGGRWGPDEQRW